MVVGECDVATMASRFGFHYTLNHHMLFLLHFVCWRIVAINLSMSLPAVYDGVVFQRSCSKSLSLTFS